MDSSAPRLSRLHALSLTTIASRLAPTGGCNAIPVERAGSGRRSDDGLKCVAFIQATGVIVDDHRQQAGSHKDQAEPCGSELAGNQGIAEYMALRAKGVTPGFC